MEFQVSTPLPAISSRTRETFWNTLLRRTQPSIEADFSNKLIEEKREKIRQTNPNVTRSEGEALIEQDDSPEQRAAVALELSASPAAEAEATHLLSEFKDDVSDIPRVMKRLVNAFAIRQAIGILEANDISAKVMARWTILEQRYPALAELLTDHPEWLPRVLGKSIPGGTKDTPKDALDLMLPFLNVDEIVTIVQGKPTVGKAASVEPDKEVLTAKAIRTITRGSAT